MNRISVAGVLLLFVFFVPTPGNAAESERIPFIYSTDLYHPPQDPDDHFDLAILASLPELDCKAVVFDFATAGRTPDEIGLPALRQIAELTGRAIPPWKTGLCDPLQSPEDQARNQPEDFQGGVALILKTLRESKGKVVLFLVGSCRDFTVAFNREPELVREKTAALYINAGNGWDGKQTEWNVSLDPRAYVRLMESGLPIFWCPCITDAFRPLKPEEVSAGKAFSTFFYVPNQAELLKNSSVGLKNYFAYALSRSREEPIGFLKRPEQPLPKSGRNMWCTGPFLHAAGRRIYRNADGNAVACSPEKANEQGIADREIEVYRFQNVRLLPVAKEVTIKSDDGANARCRYIDCRLDKTGKNTQHPDGLPDCRVRIEGIASEKEIDRFVITGPNEGRWEFPIQERWWTISWERNATRWDCFFTPYANGEHRFELRFADGTTESFSCEVGGAPWIPEFHVEKGTASDSLRIFQYIHPEFNTIMRDVLEYLLQSL